MVKSFLSVLVVSLALWIPVEVPAATLVDMETSHGTIRIELFPDRAPQTVENFLQYVDQGFYEGTVFHRIIKGFMIQGGGFDQNNNRKPTSPPIANEAANGLKNRKGSLAMARTSAVNSATSQFFINLADNDFLDHHGNSPKTYGYAVFGQLVDGMNVVEKIGNVKTYSHSAQFQNYPQDPVIIIAVRRVGTL